MNKFRKGNRIVYISKNPDSHDIQYKLHAGMTGTVIHDGFDSNCIGVAFDNYTYGNGEKHNEVHVTDTDITAYTPKIKAGDIVELLREPDDNALANYALIPGKTGVVIDCKANFDSRVVVSYNDFNNGWGKNKDKWFTNTNLLKKLKKPKFKFDIGDIVKVNTVYDYTKDNVGKIINISESHFGKIIYLVEFNEMYYNFHDGNISDNKLIKGSKTGRSKHCYYLHESDLVKYDKEENKQNLKFNVGDRVIIYNCLLDHDNREGKILNACKSSTGKLYYLVEMDFADPKRFHSGYSPELNVLVGYKKGKENQCYYAEENELFLLSKAGEIEFNIMA